MLYKVDFEHHYANDEEWYFYHSVLVTSPSASEIMDFLKKKYPTGYIVIVNTEEFKSYIGDVIELQISGGACS